MALARLPNQQSNRFNTRPAWSGLRRLVLTASLLFSFPLAPVRGETPPAPPASFVMGMDADAESYGGKWMRLTYGEAFRRLGIPITFETYPSKRLSSLVDAGGIDGDAARIYTYGTLHPNLLRIEEPTMEFKFSLYGTNPHLHLSRLEELSAGKLLVEYRRGLGICENSLKTLLPADRLSDVTSIEQGIKKLLARRTDLYCDNDATMFEALRSEEFKGLKEVRAVIDIGKSIQTYLYVHQKHAALAPRLTVILKQMRVEGLVDGYRLQVQREMGWVQ